MQVVILAAGKSSRFEPFRNFAHKSLIPIMGKTILEHVLFSVKNSGIKDVILVTSEDSPIPNLFGDGDRLGLHISYVEHKDAKGMGAALLDAKDFIKENFFLLNAYHVDFNEFANDMQKLQNNNSPVLLGKADTNSAYGYMHVRENKVLSIIEKPEHIEDGLRRVIGIYLLNQDFLNTLSKTPLEHYHFEKALDTYAKEHDVFFLETQKKTVTLKYPSDLLELKNYLLEKLEKTYIAKSAEIDTSTQIQGSVYIEEGVKIMENVVIKGPCYIGKNAVIASFALVRNNVDVEEGAVIGARMEIKNSLVLKKSTTHSGFIGDSIIGQNTKIAACICTANVRLDRQPVQIFVKGEKVNTSLTHFGVLIGSNANIGIRVSTMPGVIIGNDTVIGPGTTVMKNVVDNTKYFTKVEEIVEEENEGK